MKLTDWPKIWIPIAQIFRPTKTVSGIWNSLKLPTDRRTVLLLVYNLFHILFYQVCSSVGEWCTLDFLSYLIWQDRFASLIGEPRYGRIPIDANVKNWLKWRRIAGHLNIFQVNWKTQAVMRSTHDSSKIHRRTTYCSVHRQMVWSYT